MVALKLQTTEALGILGEKKTILKRNETRFGGTTTRLIFFFASTRSLAGLNQRRVTCQYARKNCW